jgi:hypothetical protein
MENSIQGRLAMYLAVKRVCESKAWVWQHSAAFADAFADFCACVENLVRLQPGLAVFRSVRRGIAVEVKVADTILTTEMDELIEKFEPVDVTFVDEYTAARSLEFSEDDFSKDLQIAH